ncbi:hypothetical protein GALMADRAFT_242832 [Galerina marginata CBS 339.88]|uniref:MYND-type domain-containing protein n=1 Tax=Galerina marginata (strain CBS 339.88) TaxID=685588 RepID=A0A067TB33_GALM3|nr:hypothetical protein GALMADRAFT_242832 [Galerina marginata CBS 339.88]
MGPPPEFIARLQALAHELDGLQNREAKEKAFISCLRELTDEENHDKTANGKTIWLLPDGGVFGNDKPEDFGESPSSDLVKKHGLEDVYFRWAMGYARAWADQPLERLPCANVDPVKNWRCQEDGKSSCGECKLVSYCSKECQRAHWKSHRQDCKDPIRSPEWQPAWVQEMRKPSFVTESTGWVIPQNQKQFALGMPIWGNIPAVDTLNLSKNEGQSVAKSNLALAYVASGDLRNVVRTVNELPSDYSGELTILLNDREPTIVLRNMLILAILGTIEDVPQAADIAVHFWGSVFIQAPHQAVLHNTMLQLVEKLDGSNKFSLRLGENSVMTGVISEDTRCLFAVMGQVEMQVGNANSEIRRVRFEPTRQDYHHRNYCCLNPSHRLASLEYRRFGILLPFGAANNNFNTPNKFLFSPSGRWLQDDLASPLDSWNIEDVIAAGKAHGAQPADLYGCLYFYLSEQLRSFSERIKKFRISFRMFTQDARELAKTLHSGTYKAHGLPKNIVFDRIDVSNIIDNEYVGIPNILIDWAPFLSKTNRCATIVGFSMNWVPKQHNSQPGPAAMERLVGKLMDMGKISPKSALIIPALFKYFTAIYDNSAAFDEYLKKQHTEEAARKAGVKLKSKHTIVPHRIGAPIDGAPSDLPQFSADDGWYWNVQVGSALLSERFVEFSRV